MHSVNEPARCLQLRIAFGLPVRPEQLRTIN